MQRETTRSGLLQPQRTQLTGEPEPELQPGPAEVGQDTPSRVRVTSTVQLATACCFKLTERRCSFLGGGFASERLGYRGLRPLRGDTRCLAGSAIRCLTQSKHSTTQVTVAAILQ